MARASIWLKAFDRERDFIAHKPMRVAGRDFVPGQTFDKTLVSTRRLRHLYEQRKVVMAPLRAEGVTPIPEHWRDLPWARKGTEDLRSLAANFTSAPIKKKADAIAVIEAELDRRGEKAPQQHQTPATVPTFTIIPQPVATEPVTVEIPDGWRSLAFLTMKAVAKKINPDLPSTAKKPEVVAVIEAELERRG